MAGGWVDWGFDFGKCEIGKLTGLSWKDGSFDRGAVGWEWGAKPKEFFAAMRAGLDKARAVMKQGQQAMENTLGAAKRTGQAMYNAGSAAVSWISSW